jgi:hypothetical protein
MKVFTINTDVDPQNQPENTSRLNVNVNVNAEVGGITNDSGFVELSEYNKYINASGTSSQQNKICIGKILLPDNRICLFSYFNPQPNNVLITDVNPYGEIGILQNESYTPVMRDGNYSLKFDPNFPIEGTAKTNGLGETIIYFTDNNTAPKWLNLTTPQLPLDNLLNFVASNYSQLLYFPSYTQSNIHLDSVSTGGGNVPTGTYIPFIAWADENYNDSPVILPGNVISIGGGTFPSQQYDGAVQGTNSGKSFTLRINAADLNTNYNYVHLYLVHRQGTADIVYDYGFTSYETSNDLKITVSTLDNLTTVDLETLTVKSPYYKTIKSITQLDDVMYLANLKAREDFDFQPYVNGIIVDCVTKEVDVNNDFINYRSEITIYDDKSFMWDEVYAIYASYTIEDEYGTYETKAYNIPGRPAYNIQLIKSSGFYASSNEKALISTLSGENDDYVFNGGNPDTDPSPGGQIYAINNNAKVFHAFPCSYNSNVTNIYGITGANGTSNMGYWENENETYPNTNSWKVLNTSGTLLYDNRNQKVRHHKFPHPSQVERQNTDPIFMHLDSVRLPAEYSKMNILGIKLKNITTPPGFAGKVKKLNIYYAKRTINNRTILGQSIGIYNCEIYPYYPSPVPPTGHIDATGQGYNLDNWTVHSGGNIKLIEQYIGLSSGPYGSKGRPVNTFLNTKFIKCSPFDVVSNDTTIQGVTHISYLYNIEANYKYISSNGNTSKANGKIAANSNWFWNPTDSSINSDPVLAINCYRIGLGGLIRKVKKGNLMESVPNYPNLDSKGYPQSEFNAGVYGYSKQVNHYRSDKTALFEHYNVEGLNYYLGADIIQGNGEESGVVPYLNGTNVKPTTTIPLVNLNQFKQNVYFNFSEQELVYLGESFTFGGQVNNIYKGDTFTNLYGYRSVTDLSSIINPSPVAERDRNVSLELRFLHFFGCQSTSNINYRNSGTNSYDIYFPKSSAFDVLGVPLMGNLGLANYYGYNKDYSRGSDIIQPVISGFINPKLSTEFPTRIHRTVKNNPESTIDYFRVLLTGDYIDLEKLKGSIWAIRSYNNKLAILFEDTIRLTLGREVMKTSATDAYIGSGDIFSVKPVDVLTTDGGYGGCTSQFSICNTPYGLFFPDLRRGKVFLLGEGLEEISKNGNFNFFRDNMEITVVNSVLNLFNNQQQFVYGTSYVVNKIVIYQNKVYKCLINNNNTIPTYTTNWEEIYDLTNFNILGSDSVYLGFRGSYDPVYKRYVLSKYDVELTQLFLTNFKGYYDATITYSLDSIVFKDNILQIRRPDSEDNLIWVNFYFNSTFSNYYTPLYWTYAYYPDYKGWVSYHTYYPEVIFNSNDSIYSSSNNKLYKHNSTDLTIYYGFPEESIVEPIFNSPQDIVKKLSSIQIETKMTTKETGYPALDYLGTFDTYQGYTANQMSKETTITNEDRARNVEGYYNVNEFRDYTADNNLAIFLKGILKPFSSNINLNKHFSKLRRLVGYWIGVRFKFKNNNNTKLTFTSGVYTSSATVLTITNCLDDINVGDVLYTKNSSNGLEDWFIVNSITSYVDNIYVLTGKTKIIFIGREVSYIGKVLPTRLTLLNTYSSVTKNIR